VCRAEEIGDSLHLSEPVRRIDQNDDGVTVSAESVTVRARHVIVAVPIAIAWPNPL
jgi:monoamine oxidase